MRKQNWRISLTNTVSKLIGTKMQWGRMDCALLAAHCYDAMFDDVSLVEWLTDKYSDEKSAIEMQNEVSVESWLRDHGAIEVKNNFQQFGDFIIFETENLLATVGVCVGDKVVILEGNRENNNVYVQAVKYKLLPPMRIILRIT